MPINTREVIYDVDGLRMLAHLAVPEGEGPWPAILIGHDGIGLDDYQRQRANELAARGYVALVIDYHGGETYFGRPTEMLARLIPMLADSSRLRAIGAAGLDALRAVRGVDPTCISALGFGAGGSIVLELARAGVGFKSIAVIHPAIPDASAIDWEKVSSKLLICTGSGDPISTPEQTLTFTRVLDEANIDWRLIIYGGAKHAFWARPLKGGAHHEEATVPGVGYHPKHAVRVWQDVLEFFDKLD